MKRHNWEDLGSLQWASTGMGYNSARTSYRCKDCGDKFTHHYHRQPDILKAMEEEGVEEECCEKI